MKYLYLFSFLIACGATARAQVNKGDIIIGGNIGYGNNSSTSIYMSPSNYTSHDLNLNPSIGMAIKDNLVLGIDLGYSRDSYETTEAGQTDNQVTNSYGAGVFLRRYRPLGNGFYLFGQAKCDFSYSHYDNESPSSTTETSDRSDGYSATLQLFPGIAYSLNRHWQIETGLPNFLVISYNYSNSTIVYPGQPEQTGTNHSFSIASSLTGSNQFTVGVRYLIGG